MMCQRIGLPPISTRGFGRTTVSSAMRVPRPPAKITTFTSHPYRREISRARVPIDRPAQAFFEADLRFEAEEGLRPRGVEHASWLAVRLARVPDDVALVAAELG